MVQVLVQEKVVPVEAQYLGEASADTAGTPTAKAVEEPPVVIAQPAYYRPIAGNVVVMSQPAYAGGYPNAGNIVIVAGPPQGMPPPDYCLVAWASCLFCFWPVGICAIVASSVVNSMWRRGDAEGAKRASLMTRNLAMLSVVIGSIMLIAIVYSEH